MQTDPYKPNKSISFLSHLVLEYLKTWGTGKENAIKINALVFKMEAETGRIIKRREIELATEELRGAGIPLCSSVSKRKSADGSMLPMGLFLARDYQEMLGWVKQIEHRMEKMAIHKNIAMRVLKAQAQREGIQCQLELT